MFYHSQAMEFAITADYFLRCRADDSYKHIDAMFVGITF
jgi:hypothetical protein